MLVIFVVFLTMIGLIVGARPPAAHAAGNPTPQGNWWAVDSATQMNATSLGKVQAWYQGGTPMVWGRYVSSDFELQQSEISFARANQIYLFFLVTDQNCSACRAGKDVCGNDTTAAQAQSDAAQAVTQAGTDNLPNGIILFKDMEQTGTCVGEPTAAYVSAWYQSVQGSGYSVGFYGNSFSQNNAFPKAYCGAAAAIPGFSANVTLDSSEPEPNFNPPQNSTGPTTAPAWVPTRPSCAPLSATTIWQYGEPGSQVGDIADIDEVVPNTKGLLAPDGSVTSGPAHLTTDAIPGWATESVSDSQVVYRVLNGKVWEKRYATWSGWATSWYSLPTLASGVTATGTAMGAVFGGVDQVFVTGSDGQEYVNTFNPGFGFSSTWLSLGLPAPGVHAVGTPSVLSATATGNLNIYVRGSNGNLYEQWYTPGFGWSSAWYNLASPPGVTLASDPATGSFRGIDQAYAIGSDGSLWQRWYTPGVGWSDGWYSLAAPAGTTLVARPSAGVFGGVNQVYSTAANGAVYQRWYTPGYGWSDGWYNLGPPAPGVTAVGSLAVQPVSVTQNDDLYVRGSDGNLYEQWYTPGHGWSSFWYAMTAPGGGTYTTDPAVGSYGGNDEVYAAAADGSVFQRWYTPGFGWSGTWYGIGSPS